MKRSIIITDLTRFKAGNPNVCIAGIDPNTGECIRPMPYVEFKECARLQIIPGGILKGEFTSSKHKTAPHTEDCNYSNLTFHGPCSGGDFKKVLLDSAFASIEEGFGVVRKRPPKHI